MAYQRPFLVSLKKSDLQQPWGFRIFGGKEYGEPHVVEKVIEGSIAERAGLREGDEIIQVGRINIQDLTFGQAQDVICRCGNKLEMFIIREDLLSPRKGKEPSHVKAVVHNPYNSPLNLYSTENIADTLAKQTEVLTEGHILTTDEEEEGPENLSFKQKSAVFQLLEEQARQDSAYQHQARGSPQRKAAPTPPPKPKPPTVSNYQNKENYYYPEQQVQNTYSTTIQSQSYRAPQSEDYYNQVNSVDYRKQEQRSAYGNTAQIQQSFSPPPVNRGIDYYQTSDHRSSNKVTPVPPPRATQPASRNTMTTVYSQQQQPQYYEQQHTQQYQEHQDIYQTQKQWPSQQAQPQQKVQPVKFQPQIQQQHSQEMKESIFEQTSTVGTPITYKAPPSQRHRINWPPPAPLQQNGVWSSPSPTPASPSKTNIEALWPPKQSLIKELPRTTGFNPAVVREQASGRRCVWPPPKQEEEFRSGRTTPQSPMMGRRVNWNPSPSPPSSRRSPFGSMSPVSRRKDIVWPPPQPVVTKEVIQHRPSPTCSRRARFDDHVKLHAASNIPTTYRAPPGTQHVEYC